MGMRLRLLWRRRGLRRRLLLTEHSEGRFAPSRDGRQGEFVFLFDDVMRCDGYPRFGFDGWVVDEQMIPLYGTPVGERGENNLEAVV